MAALAPVVAFAKAAAPVVSLVTAGANLISSLKGPKSVDMPAMPPMLNSKVPDKLETPTAMPVADSKLTQDAKRRAVMAAAARDGRASTIMTSDSGGDKFGG